MEDHNFIITNHAHVCAHILHGTAYLYTCSLCINHCFKLSKDHSTTTRVKIHKSSKQFILDQYPGKA
jgi:hypothetical protein